MLLTTNIKTFILANHVLSLATIHAGDPWSASCFYAWDERGADLIIMSAEDTLHGKAMLARPAVAGTIAGQPSLLPAIRGIQFRAQAHLLADSMASEARKIYCRRHPVAQLKHSAIWRLALIEIKFTDNSRIFGHKETWRRES